MRSVIPIIALLFFSLLGSNLVNAQSSITTTVEDLEDCNYRWFCSAWNPDECPRNGIQTRSCNNAGDCPDTYQKPDERRGCTFKLPKQLFDIKLELAHYNVYNPEDLVAWARFENFGTEPTPVNLTYIILDKKENVVYVREAYLVVETEEFVVEKFEEVDLKPGEYSILLRILYDVDIEDEFRQDFQVISRTRTWIYIVLGFAVLTAFYLIILKRKKKTEHHNILPNHSLGKASRSKRKKGGEKS